MKWQLIWTSRAKKHLDALDTTAARRIQNALDRFSETGHADLRRLVNITPEQWRIRVGTYRIILQLLEDEQEAHVIRIRRRDSAY